MKRVQISLADGRYLIFYSFDEETPPRTSLPTEELNSEAESEAERADKSAEDANIALEIEEMFAQQRSAQKTTAK